MIAAGAVASLALLSPLVRDGSEPSAQLPSKAQVCAAGHEAVRALLERYPDAPRARLEDLAKEVCRRGPTAVPLEEPVAVESTPGCHVIDDVSNLRPRQVDPPDRRIPFFAVRSGKLPPSGAPIVGGVQLPAGSRCPRFWSTDAGVEDAFGLADRLASVFPTTGLWPVIWAPTEEEPDAYVAGFGNPARADAIDAARALRRSWRTTGWVQEGPFPGIASAADAERLAVQPFGDLLEDSFADSAPPGGRMMMLIPVNRPADVISVLGIGMTEYHSDDELTAILRSWEERFGAVVSALGPGTLDLVVGAPPRDEDDARRLAAEHAAFAPDETEGLRTATRQLRDTRREPGVPSAHYWAFGWPD